MVCLKSIQILLFPEESQMIVGCVFSENPCIICRNSRETLKISWIFLHVLWNDVREEVSAALANIKRSINSKPSEEDQ